MSEYVSVAYITDENYIMPTIVSIISLLKNKKNNTCYKIYILTHEISEKSKEMLNKISLGNSLLQIIDCSDKINFKDKIIQDRHVTTSSLLKFFLAEIINEEKSIFLDGDTIIRDDLSELYNIDVSEFYLAAVKDILSERGYQYKYLQKMKYKNKFYFNTGVMLLNLNKIREEKICEKLIEYRLNGYNYFMDQDAFNMVMGDKVKYLSYKYNFLNVYFDWWSFNKLEDFYGEPFFKNKVDIYKSTKILHLGGPDKPWIYNMGYLTEEFMTYYKLSPYKSEAIKLRMSPDYLNFWQTIFSVFHYDSRMVIVFLGFKIKIKDKKDGG